MLFMTVYCKLIKIPLAFAIQGNIRLRIISNNPEYIKNVIKGETIVAEIIPIGLKEPKSFIEIGAVIV